MARYAWAWVLGAVLWGGPAGPALAVPACDEALTASQRAALDRGEVVTSLRDTGSATMKDILAIGVIDAPCQAVWHTITDYPAYARIFPDILKSEVRRQAGNELDQYTEVRYPWPLPSKWSLTRIEHDPSHHALHFHRIDGTVKEAVGSWHLYPDGDKTLAVYAVRFDPGIPFVPHWVIEWGARQELPAIIHAVRSGVKQGL